MAYRFLLVAFAFALLTSYAGAADAPTTRPGALLLGGGGILGPGAGTESVKKRFVELAGGPDKQFVLIPSRTNDIPDSLLGVPDEKAARSLGVKRVTTICAKTREVADSDVFSALIRKADAVWITGGNTDSIKSIYPGTKTQRELAALLARGGVIGGESAGAMILASHIPDDIKAPQPAAGTHCSDGFGFLPNTFVAPHVIKMGWIDNPVFFVADHPGVLGLGIDERAALVVRGQTCEVIGQSKAVIYDNADHDGKRYYLLSPGDRFDLATRRPQPATRP